jgi:2,4-dienoyl-CoA reductase-like NADH-dependent reductase (Old Yellow Enzyme family)
VSILFEPVTVGKLEIKNRFLRSATDYALSDMDGFIGRESIDLIRSLAENEVGLIVTGYAYVLKSGQSFPDMNGIQDDGHISGFQKMTEAVHAVDGRVVMQIAIAARLLKQPPKRAVTTWPSPLWRTCPIAAANPE